MTNEIKEPIGSLRISKDVLATIATNATKEIEGVAGIAPLTTNIRNWITKKQSAVPMPVSISLHDEIAVVLGGACRGGIDQDQTVCRTAQGNEQQVQIGIFEIMRGRAQWPHNKRPPFCKCVGFDKFR